ncbi:MAG: hypothetical protein J7623_25630 [Chitinophaga sp.]|uniref:OmpP1/FadL family transporter n=1 Tax=Chitinophaga sp. TaxID=1869181 RepID=UPI001B0F72E2|nr:hypothetical protein [Chitinophaga sp.]MBO9732049.1 hypothetical protein [Chitinophaga sp.]
MIKRLYPLLGGLFLSATAMAQSSNDALLYSPNQPHGTARTQALGGAGIGLGGDYSSAHLNPAGIAIFKTGEFHISAGVGISQFTSNYLGNGQLDNKGNRSNFQMPSIGVIMATNKNSGSSTWNNITFSLGMERLANYNNKMAIAGRNNQTSLSDAWVDDFFDQSVSDATLGLGFDLGYYTGMIHKHANAPGDTSIISQASPLRPGGGLPGIQQRGTIETEGGLNEYSFAIGGNYGDRLYIGASLNLPSINYKETLNWSEDDASSDKNNGFAYFDYTKRLKRTGLGFGAKLGILYKVSDHFRLGGTFATPTWYSIHDSYTAEFHSDIENNQGEVSAYSVDLAQGFPTENDYHYTAPLRAGAGASYFFGNLAEPKTTQGFITADYEYVNQSSGKFKYNNGKAATGVNDNISAIYKATSNIRAGAEVRFQAMYAVRLGFAAYGNPYTNDAYNAGIDASRKVYSGGLGFRNKGFYADLTYSYTQGDDRYQPYTIYQAAGQPNLSPKAATLAYNRSNILLTIGFKF